MPVPPLIITLDDQTLMLTRAETKMPCIPLSPTDFACDFGLLTFHLGPDGPRLMVWRTMFATRLPAD